MALFRGGHACLVKGSIIESLASKEEPSATTRRKKKAANAGANTKVTQFSPRDQGAGSEPVAEEVARSHRQQGTGARRRIALKTKDLGVLLRHRLVGGRPCW